MIIGCDPGLSGAFALYGGGALTVEDMPVLIQTVNRKERKVIDAGAIVNRTLARRIMYDLTHLVIEHVSGMPGQSGPAAFTFGYGVGVVTAAALAAGLEVERVHPATWKAALGLKADKGAARAKAAELFPGSAHLFTPRRNEGTKTQCEGRAEAALIAWYGWQTRGKLT